MLVIDAAVAVSWLIADESLTRSLAILDRVAASQAIVPVHWWLDVGNSLLVSQRRGRLAQTAAQMLSALRALPIQVDVESASRAANETIALAAKHELSSYDAAYLELALRRALPLATFDKALAGAAQAAGIELAMAR